MKQPLSLLVAAVAATACAPAVPAALPPAAEVLTSFSAAPSLPASQNAKR